MKGKNELQELILLIIIAYFICQCTFTDNVYNMGHEAFTRMGISQKIEQFENR